MLTSLHPIKATLVGAIGRRSEAWFTELLALYLAPVATTDAESHVAHLVERVRDVDAGYIAPCMVLSEWHWRPQINKWDLLVTGWACRHFGMFEWVAICCIMLHVACITEHALASDTLVAPLAYPT